MSSALRRCLTTSGIFPRKLKSRKTGWVAALNNLDASPFMVSAQAGTRKPLGHEIQFSWIRCPQGTSPRRRRSIRKLLSFSDRSSQLRATWVKSTAAARNRTGAAGVTGSMKAAAGIIGHTDLVQGDRARAVLEAQI